MSDISSKALVMNPSGLAHDVRVGPFSFVGPEVTIGAGTGLHSHVTVTGRTQIAGECELFPGCVVGAPPVGVAEADAGQCVLDERNVIREHVIIAAGAPGGRGTLLGPTNLFMVGCQVGHDASVAGEGLFANFTRIGQGAGIEKFVRTSGLTVISDYATVGAYSFTTGYASVERDAPPYVIMQGLPSRVRSINVENLRRCGFDADTIQCLKSTFRMLFNGSVTFPPPEALQAAEEASDNEHVRILVDFLRRSADCPTGRWLEPAEEAC